MSTQKQTFEQVALKLENEMENRRTVTNGFDGILIAMASNLVQPSSMKNLLAMASNLRAMVSNLMSHDMKHNTTSQNARPCYLKWYQRYSNQMHMFVCLRKLVYTSRLVFSRLGDTFHWPFH